MSAAKPSKPRQTWRENVEAMAVAIIMAVMFKYFALEAYQIPTGSMQPTLMGQDFPPEPESSDDSFLDRALAPVFGRGGSIKDRILVDKLSFHYRDPERWEVVIFKYPLNRAQNFVKRLVGMPGEQLRIDHGDLWHRASATEPWQHIPRSQRVLEAQLKALDVNTPDSAAHWAVEPRPTGTAIAEGRACSVDGEVTLRFAAHGDGPILDTYSHGYTAGVQKSLPPHPKSNRHEVGDLRVGGRIRAAADFDSLVIELRESGRSYHFEIPGPAASAIATPRISSEAIDGAPTPIADHSAPTYHLPADRWVDIRAQNIDDVLTLAIDDDVVATLDVPPCDGNARQSAVYLHAERGNAELDNLQVWRDIYYTPSESGECEWLIPKDHYFMLGDNTQDSSDSREWRRVDLAWRSMPAGLQTIGGNQRGTRGYPNNPVDANPIDKRIDGATYTFFRDMWGELWTFASSEETRIPGELPRFSPAPFVPRNLITGRAVAVFWPLSVKYSTYRWKWVR